MILNYVSSGMAHTRITYKDIQAEDFSAMDQIMQRLSGSNNHVYSFLFNAHTEKGFGNIFKNIPSVYDVHSDSGGLQVITQGLKIDASLRKKVYEVQGASSDIAMSFDEIPLTLTGAKSARGSMTDRVFDEENFERYATKSANNLREQVEFFQEKGYKTKPLLIVHGNSFDNMQRWLDYHHKVIPDDLWPHIAGMSVSGASIGSGMRESFARAFFSSFAETHDHIKKHVHMLGVGSAIRLVPTIGMIRGGLYDDVHFSYDSTSHTSGLTLGNYYMNKRFASVGRTWNKETQSIVNDMYGKFAEFLPSDKAKEFDIISMSSKSYRKKYTMESDYYLTFFCMYASMVLNFTSFVDSLIHNDTEFRRFAEKSKIPGVTALQEIKTIQDYTYYMGQVGRFLKSTPVQAEVATLDNFFS